MKPACVTSHVLGMLVGTAMVLVVSQSVSAQSLGRIFSTVEQRAELDEIRDEYEYGKPVQARVRRTDVDGEAAQPALPQVTVNGIVLRSSGAHVSWVNGVGIVSGQRTPEGIRVVAGRRNGVGEVRLVLPSGVDTAPIKPGQKIDVVNGRVVDTFSLSRSGGQQVRLFAVPPPRGTADKASAPRARAIEQGGGTETIKQ
ncbi:MAG: hypothetical protein ACI8PT_000510 [Gammaproteobacteria bacterium]|jgi:hypothetical protein